MLFGCMTNIITKYYQIPLNRYCVNNRHPSIQINFRVYKISGIHAGKTCFLSYCSLPSGRNERLHN